MKDFMDVSFKGRIASQPEFDTTKDGLPRARFQVAINKDYKNKNNPSYLPVTYLGSDAEYVKKGFLEGTYFQVGCTIMVNHANATLKPIQVTSQNGTVYTSLELDSVSAKTDRTMCMEKKMKVSQPVTYQNGACQQQVYANHPIQAADPNYIQYKQQYTQQYSGYGGYQAGGCQNTGYGYGQKGVR